MDIGTLPVLEARGIALGTGLLLLGQILYTIYQIYFGPLSKFPGPKLWAASRLPQIFYQVRGLDHVVKKELHAKYGPVVRVAPRELSFTGASAWHEIYGSKKAGQQLPYRDPVHYGRSQESIISSNDQNHTRIRRIVAPAFSDKALKEAEPRLKLWATKLRDKLTVQANAGAKIDLLKYFNCTTFDVMGDLTFSENLNMLDNGEYSSWVQAIFSGIKIGSYIGGLRKASFIGGWIVDNLIMKLPALRAFAKEHENYANRRVDRRLKTTPETPDLWTRILSKGEQKEGLSIKEHYNTANIFMIAGTETSATALSGMVYFMLRNPHTMQLLKEEIRGAFATYDDMHIDELARLKYLKAVVEEGLRMYPPAPTSLPRRTPQAGVFVGGHWIPGDVVIGVNPMATVSSNEYFTRAEEFHPERWMGDPDFANDQLDASEPFSIGPRNCVGKILAYHEMRLLLATVIYHFDLELCDESNSWTDQKVYVLWEKKPLICKLVLAKR